MNLNKNIFICALLVLMLVFCVSTVSAESSLDADLTASDNVDEAVSVDSQVAEVASDQTGDALSVSGDTIYVDSNYTGDDEDGSEAKPYKTISSAVNSESVIGGETIFIKNGEYIVDSKITVTKSLSIIGESQDGVVVKSSRNNYGLFAMTTAGVNFTLANMVVDGFGSTSVSVLQITGNSPVNIINCTFNNCIGKNAYDIETTDSAYIINCSFIGGKGSSALLYLNGNSPNPYYLDNILIEGVGSSSQAVIYVYGGNKHTNYINNLSVYNSQSARLLQAYGNMYVSNSTIVGNKFTTVLTNQNNYNVPIISFDQTIIANNTVPALFRIGTPVQQSQSNRVDISYCSIYGNTATKIKDVVSGKAYGILNADNNWWGTNDGPSGITVNSWVVHHENGDFYTLNTGDLLAKDIPGLVNNPFGTYVSADGNDTNDGKTPETAVATLKKAIEINTDGYIFILNGTLKTDDVGVVSKNFTMLGLDGAIISGNGDNRIFTVGNESSILIKDITFIDGSAKEGALFVNEGDLVLSNCIIANSTAIKGAVYNKGTLTVLDSIFCNNNAENGGAIYNENILAVSDSVFEGNAADLGGAIYALNNGETANATISIATSTFTNNRADGKDKRGGAAIYAQDYAETFTITDSYFFDNVAGYGGGAVEFVNMSSSSITGSQFIGNNAQADYEYGGGAVSFIGVDDTQAISLYKNEFVDNAVDGVGGGAIYVDSAVANIKSNVIINNYDDKGYAIFSKSTFNVTVNQNWWGSNDSPKEHVSPFVNLSNWVIFNGTIQRVSPNSYPTIYLYLNTYTDGISQSTLSSSDYIVVKNAIIRINNGTDNRDIVATINGEYQNRNVQLPSIVKYIDYILDNEVLRVYSAPSSPTTIVMDNFTTVQKGSSIPIELYINASDSSVVSRGYVEFYVDDKLVNTFEVSNNIASGKYFVSLDDGVHDIIFRYVDDENLYQSSMLVTNLTVEGFNNTVTPANFFDYFDEDGWLYNTLFNELILEGEFNAGDLLINNIVIDEQVNIQSAGAVLNDVALKVYTDGVTVNGLTINRNNKTGSAVYVYANNVILEDFIINYNESAEDDAFGIYVYGSDNVKVTNSVISVDSYNNDSTNLVHHYAVKVEDSTNVEFAENEINAELYALDVDWYSDVSGIERDLVLAVGIQNGTNITFTKNTVKTNTKAASGSNPTLDSIMVDGVTNLVISENEITQTDFSGEGKAGYSNVVDLYNFNGAKVSGNTIIINTTTGVNGAGTAYAIQLTGPYTGLVIDNNDLTAVSRGPALGIYSQNYYGGSESTITFNTIHVTGFATSNMYALVAGMELQDDEAKVYNNTIYSQSIGNYSDANYLFGISFAQYLFGDHVFDIKDNTIYTDGKYAVYIVNAYDSFIENNELYAHDLVGDDAAKIATGDDNVIANNKPSLGADIIIDVDNVWVGNNATVTVTITNTSGNITIKVNNKEYKELVLVDGVVSQVIDASDLSASNNVIVTYNTDKQMSGLTNTTTFKVVDGVITSDTFADYFDATGYLRSFVPEGATLDFQGSFIGDKYSLYINKPVNVISSTDDAVFDSKSNDVDRKWVKFNVVAGGDHTNITDISIINGDLFIQGASYVTVDDIYMKASMKGVGSGTGFLSIHSNAYYTTVKNSNFENGGTGSSCVVLGKGGKYATFDNNVFEITGSSGNVLSSNVFVGTGELPQFVNYTNNLINSHVAASAYMYGITVCGEGNIIENNSLINFKGNGIINQYGATSTKNIYRNNTITGGGSMQIGTYSLVENNNVAEGALTVTEGCTFVNNTAKSLTISGKNVVSNDNVIITTVSISGLNTTFTNNIVGGLITVTSNENTISDNVVTSTSEYAIDLKTSSNNTVTDNVLYADDLVGDKAVNYVEDNNNTVKDNLPIKPVLTVEVDDIDEGENATIDISFDQNITGAVEVIVDGKKYDVEIKDGKGQLIVSDLEESTYTVGASFAGDLLYGATENSTKFTVGPAIFMDIDTEAVLGEDAIVEVYLPDDATGTLTVTIDNETFEADVEDGYACVEIPDLAFGEHNITVAYSGDEKYHAMSANDTVVVEPNVEIPDEIDFDEESEISITLPEDATGNLTVSVDGVETTVPVVNGTASVPLDNLTPGEHNITVSYSGDGKYDPVSAQKTVDVVPAIDIPEEITTSDDDTISIDLPKDATGNLTVSVDGVETTVPVVNGTASVDLGTLTAGDHTISVSYSGDGKYAPYSKSVTANVAKAKADAKVTVPSDAQEGSVVPITITLPSDATGTVFVDVNGSGYYANVVNGTAVVNANGLTGGEKEVTYRYTGDSKYAETTGNASIAILYKPKITNNKAVKMFYYDGSKYTVRVWGTDGKVVGAGEVVTFKINGKTKKVKTNKNGYASLKITDLPKTYTITATYKTAKVSNKVAVKQILTSKNVNVKKSAKKLVLSATLKKVKGKYLKGKVIKFKFLGKTYKVKTNKKGVAKLTIKNKKVLNKLKAGKKYAVKITYVKDTISKKVTVKK